MVLRCSHLNRALYPMDESAYGMYNPTPFVILFGISLGFIFADV